MKRLILTAICLLVFLSVSAQEKKVLRGFDGGMMVHTGYLTGNLNAIDYTAKGVPMGIGGVIRLHLGLLLTAQIIISKDLWPSTRLWAAISSFPDRCT